MHCMPHLNVPATVTSYESSSVLPCGAGHASLLTTYAGAYKNLTKVGYTKELHKRVQQHTRCCQASFVFRHFPEDPLEQIHDAHGCEQAIHRHLKAAGMWPGNVTCSCNSGLTHTEWFTGSKNSMIEVVKLYVREWRAQLGVVRLQGV
jgi:hypothetical protein